MTSTSRPRAPTVRAHHALAAVCVLHAVSPYLLRGLHPGYGWDETVYISQIDPHVVAGYFSAPRARGLTFLTAPATLVTSSVTVMRAWLAVLSGIGLYLAFMPWLRLRRGWTVPLAALLWAGIWVDIFYGYEAMPNQWIAYSAVAACGWLLVARQAAANRRPWVWLGAWLLVAALIRPSDSLAIVAPLVVFAVVDRSWDRRHRVAAVALMLASVAVGWLEWVIEAFVRFGGVGARLHAASIENGGTGLHWELGAQLRALGGPLLCRYNCTASAPLADRLWWLALPLLVAGGLLAGARRRQGIARMDILGAAVAATLALEYLVLIGYAAPRFLAPSYALLAIPVAEGAVWLVLAARRRPWQLVTATFLVVVFVAHEIPQLRIVRSNSAASDRGASRSKHLVRFLRAQGVSAPCALTGLTAGPTSFSLGCYGIDTVRWSPIAAKLAASRRSTVVIIATRGSEPQAFFQGWRSVIFRQPGHPDWRVWISGRAS